MKTRNNGQHERGVTHYRREISSYAKTVSRESTYVDIKQHPRRAQGGDGASEHHALLADIHVHLHKASGFLEVYKRGKQSKAKHRVDQMVRKEKNIYRETSVQMHLPDMLALRWSLR